MTRDEHFEATIDVGLLALVMTVQLFGFAFIVYAVERLLELRRSTKEPHDQLA